MTCTAVILSADPRTHRVVPGARTLVHVSAFHDAAGLLDARFAAIGRVETERFFFLDDDDDLPADFGDVLSECLQHPEPLIYTDEVIRTGGQEHTRRGGPYSQAAYAADPTLIHHLAVCDTAAAREVIPTLPRGEYGFEPMFYWELAKRGARHVPRVGYIWHAGHGGMHRTPSITRAMVNALVWTKENP